MKKIIKTISKICLFFLICILTIHNTNLELTNVTDNFFLFTYLGVFLGFAMTIFTFIISLVDKFRDRIESNISLTKEDKNNHKNKIENIFNEIKEDILFIFYSFLIVVLITLLNTVDIPIISIPTSLIVTKAEIILSIKLEIFLLSLYSIYDLTICAFNLSTLTGDIKTD